MRERLGPAMVQGALACACAEEVDCAEPPEGLFCLLEGTLYNRLELARALALPRGVRPADLVAAGRRGLGLELWPLLRGDFTALVWDPVAQSGEIIRDQLGGRGLFVHRSGSVLAFATELRDLVAMLPRTPGPDEVAVAHWLVPAVVPEGRTFYAGLEELPPATRLCFGDDGIRAERYWTPCFRQQKGLSRAEASAQARELIERAVARRADDGASTAILLSGGIDSASVAGISRRCLPAGRRPLRAYSAVFPRHPEIDEGGLVAAIASHSDLEATAITVEPGGMLAAALPYIDNWLSPPPTPNLHFLRPLLDRAGEDGVRILLDGEGGDAVFWYSAPLLRERLRRGRLLSTWSLAGRFPEYGRPTSRRTRLSHLRLWGRSRDFSPTPQPWLSVPARLLESKDPELKVDGGPLWWRAQLAGILGPGSAMVHQLTRRNGALSGLEARHPLLDVDLIEAVLSFPPGLAFDRNYNRPVLREAVAGLVPDEVRLRPYKSNFDAVTAEGMESDLSLLKRLLLAPGALVGAYTDRCGLAVHLGSPPRQTGERRAWFLSLWQLATMECLLRLQAGEESVPKALISSIRGAGYSFSML